MNRIRLARTRSISVMSIFQPLANSATRSRVRFSQTQRSFAPSSWRQIHISEGARSSFRNLLRRRVPRYSRFMADSSTKRAQKMVTIHSLDEMKRAAHENDPKTKLLVLGLGEAIVTTCGQARAFLGSGSLFQDSPKGAS